MKHAMHLLAALAIAGIPSFHPVHAEDKPADCDKAGGVKAIEGKVTRVDLIQGKLTVRAGDGGMHEFQAARETLAGYKPGSDFKATLRPAQRCG